MRLTLAAILVFYHVLAAAPVGVRYPEGSVHGFLSLRSEEGKILASGEVTQIIHGDQVTAHLVFRFKDGSLDDETATFSQHGVFRLLNDHHIQRGPVFASASEVFIDTASGKVTVHYQEKGKEKVTVDRMDLPSDLANGAIIDFLKNISPSVKEAKLSWLACTPKPRLIQLSITPTGQSQFSIAGLSHRSTRFAVKPELGGIAGVVAPLIGKQPPDIYVWIAGGETPAFVKSVGPQYLSGPAWTIEMANPVW